jgi:hypothetical protein
MFTIKVKEYREVGAFYLALWEHLDALSGKSRWLQASDVPSFEQRKRNLRLEYERLSELKLTPEVLRSVNGEYSKTVLLGDEFLHRGEGDVALRHQIEDWKSTLQTLGLECSRLSFSE